MLNDEAPHSHGALGVLVQPERVEVLLAGSSGGVCSPLETTHPASIHNM